MTMERSLLVISDGTFKPIKGTLLSIAKNNNISAYKGNYVEQILVCKALLKSIF
jgi:hypothetical protein